MRVRNVSLQHWFASLVALALALPANAQIYPSRAITIVVPVAPAGTPVTIVNKMNAEVQRVLNDPAFRERSLDPLMFVPLSGSPAEFAAYIRADVQKWDRVIREADIKLD